MFSVPVLEFFMSFLAILLATYLRCSKY